MFGSADQKPKSARITAAEVFEQFDPERDYASGILNRLLQQTDQKQRATDLVLGTTRNRFAIDTVIATFSANPIDRIPARLLNVIRLAAYELIYCPETPQYSIVNEAVEGIKRDGGKKQMGFVNAVLREIVRHTSNRQAELSQTSARCTLPQSPMSGCEFDRCFLPDPRDSQANYLATAFSLPRWLIAEWLEEFGVEVARQICFASNRRPSTYIRPNPLKTTTQELAECLRQAGINQEGPHFAKQGKMGTQEIVPEVEMIRIKGPAAVTELPGFSRGLFTVQDITASQPVKVLKPQPNWTILDLCAAPGVKTTQLAEATGDSARIIATDIDRRRLERVIENIARLGINNVRIVAYKELMANRKWQGANRQGQIAAGDKPFATSDNRWRPFDAVLLDVPCSNTGVLARRPEVRYRIRAQTSADLAKTQIDLLRKAAIMIRASGRICYSTCSIQKDENSRLVRRFLAKNHDFELQYEQLWLPVCSSEGLRRDESAAPASSFGRQEWPDHDGGYVAIMAKRE